MHFSLLEDPEGQTRNDLLGCILPVCCVETDDLATIVNGLHFGVVPDLSFAALEQLLEDHWVPSSQNQNVVLLFLLRWFLG